MPVVAELFTGVSETVVQVVEGWSVVFRDGAVVMEGGTLFVRDCVVVVRDGKVVVRDGVLVVRDGTAVVRYDVLVVREDLVVVKTRERERVFVCSKRCIIAVRVKVDSMGALIVTEDAVVKRLV